MKRLLALACVLALTLLGGCMFMVNKGDAVVTESMDFTKVGELARAECVPEGARLISEEYTATDDEVSVVIKFEKDGNVYKSKAVYMIVESYELQEKSFSPSK